MTKKIIFLLAGLFVIVFSALAVDTETGVVPVLAEGTVVIYPQLGHDSGVTAIAYKHDGSLLLSAYGNSFKLWDINTGRASFRLRQFI